MKAGLITSVAVHAVVLGAMFVSFSSPMTFDATVTASVPISLVPLGDEMVVRKGDSTAAKSEKPAPKPTVRPPVPELEKAQHAGDGKVDIKAPLKPKEKPRKADATPQTAGRQDARSDALQQKERLQDAKPDNGKASAVEIKPAEAALQEKMAKTIQEEVKTTPPTPVAARPEKTMPILPEIAPAPVVRPKPEKPQQAVAKTERKPQPETKQPVSAARGDPVADLVANAQAVLDKTRTQGGGAKRSEEQAAFGGEKTSGDGNLQQTLDNIIGSCVKNNWNLAAINGSTAYDLRVVARFRLNRDGFLDGEPELTPAGGDDTSRGIIMIQAREALAKCSPFSLPADKYDRWHNVTVNMKAFSD